MFRSSARVNFRPLSASHVTPHASFSFTLIELLVVIGITTLLAVLIVPVVNSLKGSKDITSSAYAIKDSLAQARAHAMANNTYVWVGFFEENGAVSPTDPATAGTGRVVVCTVASQDGTKVYGAVTSPAEDMDPNGTKLVQVGRLLKLENTHLRTFTLGTGDGTDTFVGRPPIPGSEPDNAQIGDVSPPDSLRYFHYPPTKPATTAQYTFKKMLQFSPQGEGRPQNDNYSLRTVNEIGIQPAHGPVIDNVKVCAIQLSGFSGHMKIYRP